MQDATQPSRAQTEYRIEIIGDPSRIRTCNPRSRNPLLYPVELWDRNFSKLGLHSIANMKNPLSGQAPSEPFLAIRRQSLIGGPLPSARPSRNAPPPWLPAQQALRPSSLAMSHTTFSLPRFRSNVTSPSPFRAFLFETRALVRRELHHDRFGSCRNALRNAGAWPYHGAGGGQGLQ